MATHPPSAAAAPLLRRTGRKAFPTPRGATGGCPPDTVCGGRPRDPRGAGKATRRAALRGVRTSSRAACGARTPRRDALLAGNLATPSYGCTLADAGH